MPVNLRFEGHSCFWAFHPVLRGGHLRGVIYKADMGQNWVKNGPTWIDLSLWQNVFGMTPKDVPKVFWTSLGHWPGVGGVWIIETFEQPYLCKGAKKGLKMRHAFSTNFLCPSYFVLSAGWFRLEKIQKSAVARPVSTLGGFTAHF